MPQARVTIIVDGLTREWIFVPKTLRSSTWRWRRAGPAVLLPRWVCCTCRARVLERQVRMDKNFSLEQSDVDDGFVLTCCPSADRAGGDQFDELTESIARAGGFLHPYRQDRNGTYQGTHP